MIAPLWATSIVLVYSMLHAQRVESKGFHLADHDLTSDALTGIEILIGVDHFTTFIVRQKRSQGTSLFVTKVGGVIPFGPLPRWATTTSGQSVSQVRCARIICENKPEVKITQSWDLERIGIVHDEFSPSERETVSVVHSNMKYKIQVTSYGCHSRTTPVHQSIIVPQEGSSIS